MRDERGSDGHPKSPLLALVPFEWVPFSVAWLGPIRFESPLSFCVDADDATVELLCVNGAAVSKGVTWPRGQGVDAAVSKVVTLPCWESADWL